MKEIKMEFNVMKWIEMAQNGMKWNKTKLNV